MSKAESVIFLDMFFIMLLAAYGFQTSTGGGFTAFQSIQSPTLAPTPSAPTFNCSNTDLGCQANNIARATAYIGWAIVNMPILIVYFTVIGITFSNIVLSLAFSPNLSVKGVPYFGLIFFGLQTYIIFEALRFFRGQTGSAGI